MRCQMYVIPFLRGMRIIFLITIWERNAYIAIAANEHFIRKDGKFANLIYNPEKIR